MDPVIAIVLILVALIAGAAVGGLLAYKKGVAAGVEQRKRDAEAMVGSAEKQAERIVADAEKDVADGESVLKSLSDSFDELISWAELYDEASFEKKKMIVNCLIKRVEVCRGYKLKIEFNIDFEQFMVGIDKVA
jgi:hypothetical protein